MFNGENALCEKQKVNRITITIEYVSVTNYIYISLYFFLCESKIRQQNKQTNRTERQEIKRKVVHRERKYK